VKRVDAFPIVLLAWCAWTVLTVVTLGWFGVLLTVTSSAAGFTLGGVLIRYRGRRTASRGDEAS
jgi:hypothetical protein